MNARMALSMFGLAAAAMLAATDDARAQCRLCETPTTAPDQTAESPIALQIEAALDFDRIVVMGSGEGSATLFPDGTRQVSGSVEAISGRAMVGEASVAGEPGRQVRIDLPGRIDLYSVSGGKISIDKIVTDLPDVPRLDSAGKLRFRFGGRIRVSGTSDGDFRGDLPLTVEYL
ncbi:MAG TPA: DUF4402 domain-containing protein [Sphingomicrobium sp.]|nr:DUF4402 domain-containing protein [Sphingomicrobium sp.]